MKSAKHLYTLLSLLGLLMLPITSFAQNWSTNELGADYQIINDANSSTVPFTIGSGAPQDTMVLDSTGNVGFGTNTPGGTFEARIHIADETPEILLDSGSQLWYLFANLEGMGFGDETNLSVPFFVETAAPFDSLRIDSEGKVGLGIEFPAAKLHVVDTTDAQVRVQNTADASGFNTKVMFNLINDGGIRFDMLDNSTGNNWVFQNQFGTFDVTLAGTGTREFRFNPNGNLEISGTLISASSRTVKNTIAAVDQESILDKVLALEINEWSYNAEAGIRHIGPMSEDFFESFGLGSTDKGMAVVDTAGVALAAIQGLSHRLNERERRIDELERANAELGARLKEVEDLQQIVKEMLIRESLVSND